MKVYLDNNATTKIYPEVAEKIKEIMINSYGNPSSLHQLGLEAQDIVEESSERIAKNFNVNPFEIYYTSGATESINWALKGSAYSGKKTGKHIVTSSIEHSAVISCMKSLERQGYEIDYINAGKNGIIDLNEFEKKLRKDTVLVSVMSANNETGMKQPVEKISEMVREISEYAVFHVDAVQSAGKEMLDLKSFDMASFSAHKFHGPKGSGILYKKEGIRTIPLVEGGSQQRGLRGGTYNVHGIAGTAEALDMAVKNICKYEEIKKMRNYIMEELEKYGLLIITEKENSVPNTVCAVLRKRRADTVVNALSDEGIYISRSSACSSRSESGSRVLKAMGYTEDEAMGMMRISLSDMTTADEVEYFLIKLKNILSFLKF